MMNKISNMQSIHQWYAVLITILKTAFEVKSGSLGAQNSLAGGGRYNGLVSDLGGPESPGIGFAVGIERLISCLPED